MNTATITDFVAGSGGESLDYNALLNQLSGWDGSSNPFGSGFIRLFQDGADTLFQIDRDGGSLTDDYATVVRFQNTNANDFITSNFSPAYPTDGSGISGQAISGTGTVSGTIGDDSITGSPSNDTLIGGNGADHLSGLAGADMLTGGFGADSFVFNFPSDGVDTITDFVSGSSVGDHLEISAAGFGAGSLSLVTAEDASSASNAGSDGYFIFDNSGANSGTLYWDASGGSGTDAIPFVVLTGVTVLQPSDFHLV